MTTPTTYNVQCLSGHVFIAALGSEIETKCKAHAETHLDALILGPGECPDCLEEERRRARQFASSCGESGCAMVPQCQTRCLGAEGVDDVGTSAYADQLRPAPKQERIEGVTLNGQPLYT